MSEWTVERVEELLTKATRGPHIIDVQPRTGLRIFAVGENRNVHILDVIERGLEAKTPSFAHEQAGHNAALYRAAPEIIRWLLDENAELKERWNTRFNTFCGNCGNRYRGPRDDHLHGLGVCQ